MQQQWNLKTRSHECARTGRPFAPGEVFHTGIYFDTASGEFIRRDVSNEAWAEELAERTPIASWKAPYEPPEGGKSKPEITTRESAETLLRRLIEEDQSYTHNARYILALMLERKKLLAPKEIKDTEQGRIVIYEHRKSGEVYILQDPELTLSEIDAVQEEVATLLGFEAPPPKPVKQTATERRLRRKALATAGDAVGAAGASEGENAPPVREKRGRKRQQVAETALTPSVEAPPKDTSATFIQSPTEECEASPAPSDPEKEVEAAPSEEATAG